MNLLPPLWPHRLISMVKRGLVLLSTFRDHVSAVLWEVWVSGHRSSARIAAGRRVLKQEVEFHNRLSFLGPLGQEDRVDFFAPHHIPTLPTSPGEKHIVFSVIAEGLKLN